MSAVDEIEKIHQSCACNQVTYAAMAQISHTLPATSNKENASVALPNKVMSAFEAGTAKDARTCIKHNADLPPARSQKRMHEGSS